ncbi:MAG: hypothetical protein ACAI44_36935 [Candidatus Sericytochromatia bacterium]
MPDYAENWLRAHPDVDVVCHGEGDLPNRYPGLLEDAVFLSANLIQLNAGLDPYPLEYHTRWNVWDYFQALLQARPIALQPEHAVFVKHWPGAPLRVRCLPGSSR